jgi:hypothetical protein
VSGPTTVELSSANAQERPPSGDVIVMGAPPPPENAGSRRRGFWIGFGPAYAAVNCDACDDDVTSAAGFTIHLGGTVSPHLRIGGSIDVWARESDGVGAGMSNTSLVLMYFPSTTLGLRLTGGVGVAALGFWQSQDHEFESGDGEGGVGYIAGVAWEAMVARKFALTPFVSFLGGSFDRGDASYWLFGLAATWP